MSGMSLSKAPTHLEKGGSSLVPIIQEWETCPPYKEVRTGFGKFSVPCIGQGTPQFVICSQRDEISMVVLMEFIFCSSKLQLVA